MMFTDFFDFHGHLDRVKALLTDIQNMACDYGKRHPKGPCDCKFGAAGVGVNPLLPTGTLPHARHIARVGTLINGHSTQTQHVAYNGNEETGCPELRIAIELIERLKNVTAFVVGQGFIHKTWPSCICEQCVAFRTVLSIRAPISRDPSTL